MDIQITEYIDYEGPVKECLLYYCIARNSDAEFNLMF